jgi:hypothetical protein
MSKYPTVIAQSIGIVIDNHIKGGQIKIASTDPAIQKKFDEDFDNALIAFFNLTAGGLGECIRQMKERKMGTSEELAYSFAKLLAGNIDAARTVLPGGLNG